MSTCVREPAVTSSVGSDMNSYALQLTEVQYARQASACAVHTDCPGASPWKTVCAAGVLPLLSRHWPFSLAAAFGAM